MYRNVVMNQEDAFKKEYKLDNSTQADEIIRYQSPPG